MSFSAVNSTPPRAQRRPTDRCFHGDHFEDPYEWMRNREDPATKAYVRDQNSYCQERLAGQKGLRATLLKEFTDRVQQTDMSVCCTRSVNSLSKVARKPFCPARRSWQ